MPAPITLKQRLEKARELVPVGSHWSHHKKTEVIYEVVSLGFIEASEELAVVYKTADDSLVWIRPIAEFVGKVRRDDGTEGLRFNRLS